MWNIIILALRLKLGTLSSIFLSFPSLWSLIMNVNGLSKLGFLELKDTNWYEDGYAIFFSFHFLCYLFFELNVRE